LRGERRPLSLLFKFKIVFDDFKHLEKKE
jgi:hypothetical protein